MSDLKDVASPRTVFAVPLERGIFNAPRDCRSNLLPCQKLQCLAVTDLGEGL